MAEEVAQPPAEQQEAAEGQQVGVHDPGERLLREAEIVPDRRQRDVHDRPVEHDHQVAEAEDVEGEPAGAVSPWSSAVPFRVLLDLEGLDRPAAPNSSVGRADEFSPALTGPTHRWPPQGRARSPSRSTGPIARADLPGLCDAGLRAARGERRRRRLLRRERRRAGRRDGRRARPAPARRAAARLPGPAPRCVAGAARARRLHGPARRPARTDGYASSSSGRPKSGNSVSVSRKNVNSTIRPSEISSTWSAHGS